MTQQVLPYGDNAYLVRCDADRTLDLLHALDQSAKADNLIIEAHPGEDSILVQFDPADALAIRQWLAQLTATGERQAQQSELVTLDVTYDGEDLEAVADACNLPIEALIARHTATEFQVAFCGFQPGFAYLHGLPKELQLPRREVPRTTVPAGSVAIAAHYCAVYPARSPGGWHLLGRCDETLFDPSATNPALLRPGTRVRFRAIP